MRDRKNYTLKYRIYRKNNYIYTQTFNGKTMHAYEFNTVVRGGTIQIPKQLPVEKLARVRVILLAEPEVKISEPRKNKFTAMRLKTKGLTFNREETHER
jgi:hypothetical protein